MLDFRLSGVALLLVLAVSCGGSSPTQQPGVVPSPAPSPSPSVSAGPDNTAACQTVDQQVQQLVENFSPASSGFCETDDDCAALSTQKNLPHSGLCVARCGDVMTKAQAFDWEQFIQRDPELSRVCELRESLQCPARLDACALPEVSCVDNTCVQSGITE